MIKCKATGQYHPTAVLCTFLSQKHLREQLKKSVDSRKNTPKTFPVEFKAASSPPIHRDASRDKCDRAVLEALSRANQNAIKDGTVLTPFNKQWSYHQPTNMTRGAMLDVKTAGHNLAEQFIQKYPESFKIRFSDKLSLGNITYIQEICRDKKIQKAHQIFKEIKSGCDDRVEDKKKDLASLLDLFSFYNYSEECTDWARSYNDSIQSYEYSDSSGTVIDLPYSKSLLKTFDVESRNVELVKQNLISADQELPKEKKIQLLEMAEYSTMSKSKSGFKGLKGISNTIDQQDSDRASVSVSKATMPAAGDDELFVSVMDDSSLADEVLQYMKSEGLVTAGNYDSIIQSAVKFYRPDLALHYYKEMRAGSLHPSTDTISDLIYSITHNMEPEQFAQLGAPVQITQILEDLASNPNANVTDEIFLHLFYGVHMTGQATVDEVQAVHKYNYHILSEMEQCLQKGMFKMRYSTAYKILVMNNLTVADMPKPYFTKDLTITIYDLYHHHHQEYFVRDLENDDCLRFLPILIGYARVQHPHYDMDKFYTRHLDDIKATLKSMDYSTHCLTAQVIKLISLIRFDLSQVEGVPLPEASYRTLEDIKDVTIWDFYRDCFKDDLKQIVYDSILGVIFDMFKTIKCLDPFTTEVDYMLEKYKTVLDELHRANELSIKSGATTGGNDNSLTVKTYIFLETFFNTLNSSYLCHFSNENIHLHVDQSQATSMTMSEANILDVVDISLTCINLLLTQDGIPNKQMVDVLLTHILLSGEHTTAWKMLELYNTYNIPLEDETLLKFIRLTPDWIEQDDLYLDKLSQPFRSVILKKIVTLEEKNKKDVVALSLEKRYIPTQRFVQRQYETDSMEKTLNYYFDK